MTERTRRPDISLATSMLDAADADMRYVLSLPRQEKGGATILRGIYEAFRQAGNAMLRADGIESEGHDAHIGKVIRLNSATTRTIRVLETLKRVRNNINYQGYSPGIADLTDFASFADENWNIVLKDARRYIQLRKSEKIQ